MSSSKSSAWLARGRSAALGVALTVATVWLASIFNPHYPVREWLFFRYLVSWAGALAFCLAALSVGNLVVSALSRPGERQDGHITVSFATGVYCFFVATFVTSLLHGLRPAAFVLIPVALFAIGAKQLARDLLEWRRSRAGRPWFEPLRPSEVLAFAFGAVALVFLYVPTLLPENTAYDTRWYHLGLAEHYVAARGIERLPEGPVFATVPQLATVLYAWAFLLPGSQLFDRVELAAHLEFVIFLFTLPGIPALVRYLVPDARARSSWVALFFFPAIFLYDASLYVASDHVAALWSIPTYLMMARAWPDLRPSACLLFALQAAGLAMSKYTAPLAAVFPVLALLGRAVWLFSARLRGNSASNAWVLGPATALVSGFVLTAPHWLKNLVWYGDPLYPILHRHLEVRPWVPEGPLWYAQYDIESWAVKGPLDVKLQTVWRGLRDYSYGIYNWPDFHGSFPIVGSLFTFGLVSLPFLRGTRRVWALIVAGHVGIACWALMFAHDRYLQPLLPWMAAAIAALAILVYRTGKLARIGLFLLGGVQLVWGMDMVFWPLHKMTAKSGMAMASDFFGQAYAKQFEPRTRPFDDFARIGEALPDGSKILLHHSHVRLGIKHQTVWDWPHFQFGISYGSFRSSRDLDRWLRDNGVTHVVYQGDRTFGDESLAGDLIFHTYVKQHLANVKSIQGRVVGELPREPPPAERSTVFYFGCDSGPASGLYQLSDLAASPMAPPGFPAKPPPEPRRPLTADPTPLLEAADRAIVDSRCPDAPELRGFDRVARSDRLTYFAREK
jgi:hypothetical protein